MACLAIGATAFLTIGLPRWFPEQCAHYSPSADQVVGVYLVYARYDLDGLDDRHVGEIAKSRIAKDFRARAIPALLRALSSPGPDAQTRYLALSALGAIGPEAGAAIPVAIVAMRSGAIDVNGSASDFVYQVLVRLGPSPAWKTALADPGALGFMAIDMYWRNGGVDGFLTLWRALMVDAVKERQYLIDRLTEFDYAGFKQRGERLTELIADLKEVEAHGTEYMSGWASWILYQVEDTE